MTIEIKNVTRVDIDREISGVKKSCFRFTNIHAAANRLSGASVNMGTGAINGFLHGNCASLSYLNIRKL